MDRVQKRIHHLEFGEEVDLAEASKSLADFSDAYQVAADQPIPLFKRR